MKARTLYQDLRIKKTATEKQIKSAYRKLAKEFHPDKNGDKTSQELQAMESVFKRINDAYEILSDPAKRKIYDETGEEEDKDFNINVAFNEFLSKCIHQMSDMQFLFDSVLTPINNECVQHINKNTIQIAKNNQLIDRIVNLQSTVKAPKNINVLSDMLYSKADELLKHNKDLSEDNEMYKKFIILLTNYQEV